MKPTYNFAFVGAGISSAYTLIHFISELEKKPFQRPVKIVVLEKSGEFWTGVPYGKQSGYNPLIITSIREFIPQQSERDHFIDWIKKNKEWVFDNPQQREGELSVKWHKAHKEAVESGRWDDLFVPRYIFGLYMKGYIQSVLEDAQSKGLIEVSLLTARVEDIQFIDNQYQIQFSTNSENVETIISDKLVLAVGSPPNIGFGQSELNGSKSHSGYLTDIYEPSLDFNIDRICETLEQIEDPLMRQILMVGSNASTLDTLYALINSSRAKQLVDKFIILSPNGAFPHRITKEKVESDFKPQNLIALAGSRYFTAKKILEEVRKDVNRASELGYNIADIFPEISRCMLNALDLLDTAEQKEFVAKYAVEIGKLQRRAGWEYLEVVDELLHQKKLEFIKGRFTRYISSDDGGPGVEYLSSSTSETKVLTDSIGMVVVCAGFQEVTRSNSGLIQNLIKSKICTPNESNRGFILNEKFETSKNCYLMGPLVAGNLNKSFRVWHAESCSRIIQMSKKLAEALVLD